MPASILEDTKLSKVPCGSVDIVWQLMRTCNRRYVIFVRFTCSVYSAINFLIIQFVSEAFQPRTRVTHTVQCSSLGGPLHDHYATTYGITRDSILNTSRYFHITEGLVPDVMHDVLEGALQLEVKELIRHLINNETMCLSELADIMECFVYAGPDADNKPTPIAAATLKSRDHLLKQTGELVYGYTFVITLPLITCMYALWSWLCPCYFTHTCTVHTVCLLQQRRCGA